MSSLRKITLRCADDIDYVFPAWPVEVPNLPDWEFVVHKCVTSRNEWGVSEVTTGFAAITPDDECSTLEEAQRLAIEKLANISPERCAAAIEKAKAIIAERAMA